MIGARWSLVPQGGTVLRKQSRGAGLNSNNSRTRLSALLILRLQETFQVLRHLFQAGQVDIYQLVPATGELVWGASAARRPAVKAMSKIQL